MKTTLDLPRELLIAAKRRAAQLRQPFRQLVEDALRVQLALGTPTPKPRRRRIHWVTVPGGLPKGLNISDREQMSDWLGQHQR